MYAADSRVGGFELPRPFGGQEAGRDSRCQTLRHRLWSYNARLSFSLMNVFLCSSSSILEESIQLIVYFSRINKSESLVFKSHQTFKLKKNVKACRTFEVGLCFYYDSNNKEGDTQER